MKVTKALQENTDTLMDNSQRIALGQATIQCVAVCFFNASAARYVLPAILALAKHTVQKWRDGNVGASIISGISATALSFIVGGMTAISYDVCDRAVDLIPKN